MHRRTVLALCCALSLPLASFAQVTMSDEEYSPPPSSVTTTSASKVVPVIADLPISAPAAAANAGVSASPGVSATPAKRFQLVKGEPIHTQLEAWANAAGWDFHWYPTISWLAIAAADFSRSEDVSAAVAEVVQILRDEGKPVQLKISSANHVMEVISNQVRSVDE